jgi:hypothetical protein
MTGLFEDLRYALRQLRQHFGFACTSIVILSLGICASVAILGFVDAALIKPLPYPNAYRLLEVTESVPMIPRANLVRMALAAQRGSVYQLIMREAAGLTGVGIAAGLVCSVGIATLIRRLLFHVQSWDAKTLFAAAGRSGRAWHFGPGWSAISSHARLRQSVRWSRCATSREKGNFGDEDDSAEKSGTQL